MNTRVGVRIGGVFAVAACALLAACGGGGGGGGVTPQTSATPVQTPTPTPTFVPGSDAPMPAITSLPQPGIWSPYQVASALQMPVIGGYSGVGETIAIVGDATPAPADVSGYLAAVGLSSRAGGPLKIVNIDGGPDGSGSAQGDDQEATLDVETALGLAPGATVEFLAIPNTETSSFIAGEQYVLTDPLNPVAVSESFGGCEYNSATTEDPLFAQAAAKGIAYTAASGDEGNECSNTSNTFTVGVNYPASHPNVIGVGGNENVKLTGSSNYVLTSLLAPIAWNDDFFSGSGGSSSQGATGGGVSGNFPIPSYQATLAGVASTASRNVPDITMPSEAVGVYYQGQWEIFGGTSWGAPQAAALVAELDEYCHGTPGNAVAAFYTAYSRSNGSAYVDVTSGNNQFGSSSPYYTAKAGYDDATGLGLPLGKNVASQMCPSRNWSFVTRTLALSAQTLGEARDTDLKNAVNMRFMSDLGARNGDAATPVSILIRNTQAAPKNEQTVITALQAAGFRITQTYPSHLLIQATAPASVVNSYFQTAIHNVYEGRYGQRYANVASTTVPAAIAPYVQGVVADNVIRKRRLSHRMQ